MTAARPSLLLLLAKREAYALCQSEGSATQADIDAWLARIEPEERADLDAFDRLVGAYAQALRAERAPETK